jgi:methyl-accepting chemotaxis protein
MRNKKLSIKIAGILILVMIFIMAIFTVYFVKARTANMEEELLSRGRIEALTGATTMERVLEDALASGRFTMEELFDENYVPIPGTDPPKYHTKYDAYLDKTIQSLEDEYLKDEQVVFAVLVDRNGYLPTHNSRFSQPLTGDREKDRLGNRTKRLFNDEVGLKAAHNNDEILKQVYNRDTGERMWDISTPVHVQGKKWGSLRIGFSMAQTEKKIAALKTQIIGAMGFMLAVSIITILGVVSFLVRPLLRLTAAARYITAGNFDRQIPVESDDEIGTLADAFNTMTTVIVHNLKDEIERGGRLFASIKEATGQLSTSATHMTAISAQQSSGSAEQAAAVQQVTTTSAEIAITAKQIADNSRTVEELAEETSRSCQASTGDVTNAIEGMTQLRTQVQTIAACMLQLGDNSQKIGGIVEIIDEISDQTNLLALNAAIEAAGAGEAGKRFAIVAKEVKRLAERTVEATRQIRGLIEEIQKATNSTIVVTEEGTKGVDAAAGLVDKLKLSFDDIIRMVVETARAAKEISFSTRQQTSACDQMAETMNEVRDVAQQVADCAAETERAIGELTALTENLRHLMEEEIQSKGKSEAFAGARLMEQVLAETVDSGRFTLEELFDEAYVPITGTDPVKYHTRYDAYLDTAILHLEDEFLAKDSQVVFAVLVDRNGYLPTHNSIYSLPLTGDPEKDRTGNRTKRMFNDPVGLKAARNLEEILVQIYCRDTGEKIWDISVPVYLRGKHWGAFRIGYSM